MSDELLYKLQITVEGGSDISDVEEKLEELLMELYDVGTVEAILVRDRTPPIDEDLDELLDIVDDLNTTDIQRAMDLVDELENLDDE